MPGFVYLNLGHHPGRKVRRRGQARQMFQGLDHLALLLERRAALVALAQMRLEGGNAKADLSV
ncbi:MAG TPA: hypothetical protein VK733_04625 [Gemmatimonadaceae bacterium]|nr:hypothetical protein [Gemmatimonadaceae bacterium]